jgi:hypothetical protein
MTAALSRPDICKHLIEAAPLFVFSLPPEGVSTYASRGMGEAQGKKAAAAVAGVTDLEPIEPRRGRWRDAA